MEMWILFVFAMIFVFIGYYIGRTIGIEQGQRDGYLRGRAVSRSEFWRE